MILPVLTVPGQDIQSSSNNKALVAYLEKVGFLGPALLKVTEASVCVDLVTACVFSKAACMLTGLKLDDDELVTSLLDNGLRVAFFNALEKGKTDEAELQAKVLGSLPRSRVGVSTILNIEDIGADNVTSKLKETMTETVSTCGADVMSLYFEVTTSGDSGNSNL